MKTNYVITTLFFLFLFGAPVMAQSESEATFASAGSGTTSLGMENKLLDTEENAYEQHTRAAQNAIRAHLEANLSYSEQLIAHRVVGRTTLIVDIDADGQVSATGIHQSLTTESDALALKAIECLELAEGPYLGARTIFVPVDFKLN